MCRRGHRFILALMLMMSLPVIATSRPNNMAATRNLLYAYGTAGINVDGQIELVLATGDETSASWTACNDGTDEILISMGSVKGTELTTPTNNAPAAGGSGGKQVTMGTVGRLPAAKCVEIGNFSSQTAVLQGETTTQAFSVWGTR